MCTVCLQTTRENQGQVQQGAARVCAKNQQAWHGMALYCMHAPMLPTCASRATHLQTTREARGRCNRALGVGVQRTNNTLGQQRAKQGITEQLLGP